MNSKIPPDAFQFYYSLGPGRSYQAVADKYGVSKRGVTLHAAKEKWQQQIVELEAQARQSARTEALESLEQMNSLHLKALRFLLTRGIEGLKQVPVEKFGDAARAVVQAIDRERLVRGEPTERTENVEAIIKREYARWLKPVGEEDWPEAEGAAGSSEHATEASGADVDNEAGDAAA